LLLSARQNNQYAALVTIDFSKVFDCLNFDLLLESLSRSGFNGTSLTWFSSYIHGRSQRTKYFNAYSSSLPLTSGSPQGSCLAPILFNIYINSLLRLLPDDNHAAYVTLVAVGSTHAASCSAMQTLLTLVHDWSTEYGLTISPTKCHAMCISPKAKYDISTQAVLLYIGSALLPIVTSMRILGVIFTNDLSWHVHCSATRKKISSLTGVIQRFGSILNADCRKKLIHAFVTPHLRYCLPVWGSTLLGTKTAMNTVLLRAARIMLNNRHIELDNSTYAATGLCNFNTFLSFCNVS